MLKTFVRSFLQVWSIRIDVCILDNAGNLIDASAVAMMAALLYFRKSAVDVAEGTHEVCWVHGPLLVLPSLRPTRATTRPQRATTLQT